MKHQAGERFRLKRRFETCSGCVHPKGTEFTLKETRDSEYLLETEQPGTYRDTGKTLPFDKRCRHPEIYKIIIIPIKSFDTWLTAEEKLVKP